MNEIHDLQQVCRSCLAPDSNMKSIHEIKVSEAKQIHLTDFIRRLTSLKISTTDDFPKMVCDSCIEQFRQAYKIAEMFLESDVKLKSSKFNRPVTYEVIEIMPNEPVLKNVRLPKRDLAVTVEEKSVIVEEVPMLKTVKMLYEEQGENLQKEEKELHSLQQIEVLSDNETEFLSLADQAIEAEYTETLHIQVESPKPKRKRVNKAHKCSNCSKVFASEKFLKKHELSCDVKKELTCDSCSENFETEDDLNRHECEKDKRNFVCEVCGKKFKHKHLLKLHSYKHSDVKPFPCTKCSKGCYTAESLRRHMVIHNENYKKTMHSCDICNREFLYRSFLKEHMKIHTGEKPYLCSLCGKGFRQSGALEYHTRTHTGETPYECTTCKKKFKSAAVLKVHIRSHTNERPYVCSVCGMAFRQSTDMNTHYRNIHLRDKPVLCTLCGKKMTSTGQLTIHLRSHTGEKPFSCTTCSKSFATKTTLVKHERIHSGERPYKCTICDKAFNQSSTLNSHMKTHKNKNKDAEGKVNVENCLILEINGNNTVQVKQIAVTTTEQVVILPTPVPLL